MYVCSSCAANLRLGLSVFRYDTVNCTCSWGQRAVTVRLPDRPSSCFSHIAPSHTLRSPLRVSTCHSVISTISQHEQLTAINLFTYLITPWSRVLLEKLTGLQLVKKFHAFYGTRRLLTALTSARHLSQSSPHTHLRLLKGQF
jgi:hypothetical protein